VATKRSGFKFWASHKDRRDFKVEVSVARFVLSVPEGFSEGLVGSAAVAPRCLTLLLKSVK
jgi:hypothetical protein